MERKLSLTEKLSTSCEDDRFDEVMEKVGYQGKFQFRFNMLFNFILVMFVSMPYLNIILVLAVPDHWCYVPGRNNTNYTIEEWKQITLPMESSISKNVINKCKMYNRSIDNVLFTTLNVSLESEYDIVDCQYGWEFDRTWYKETVPSQGSWVCEKELFVSNSFAFGRIGDVVGTCIFGQLGDTIGRRPVYYITLATLIIGRTLSAFSGHIYPLFLFATFVGSLPSTAVFQSPLIVAMEISEDSKRAHIAMLQCIGWTLGMCFMPFILWGYGHWFEFMLTTTLPCIIFLYPNSLMIESPRWLASQGKTAKCIRQLERIAALNGTKVPSDAMITLRLKSGQTEKAYGMLSLFSNWRLAKNTLILLISWIIDALVYYVLILNINTLDGNPFMNFFWQAIVELPAYVLAKYTCDTIGRRLNHVIFNAVAAIGCTIMAILLMTDPTQEGAIITVVSFIKFSISFVFYGINLQTLEIYPTCVRQSGLSLCIIIGSAIGILGPYIVYLGTAYGAVYPPMVLTILSLIGCVVAMFLPETLHEKLPETLVDAHNFGKHQKFWSLPRRNNKKEEYR